MISENPFDQFRQECQTALANALKEGFARNKNANHNLEQNTKH